MAKQKCDAVIPMLKTEEMPAELGPPCLPVVSPAAQSLDKQGMAERHRVWPLGRADIMSFTTLYRNLRPKGFLKLFGCCFIQECQLKGLDG